MRSMVMGAAKYTAALGGRQVAKTGAATVAIAILVALTVAGCSSRMDTSPAFFVDSVLDFNSRTLNSPVVEVTLTANFGLDGVKSYSVGAILAEGERHGYAWTGGAILSGSCNGASTAYSRTDHIAGIYRQFVVDYDNACNVTKISLAQRPMAL